MQADIAEFTTISRGSLGWGPSQWDERDAHELRLVERVQSQLHYRSGFYGKQLSLASKLIARLVK